jgi:hypothetical protein
MTVRAASTWHADIGAPFTAHILWLVAIHAEPLPALSPASTRIDGPLEADLPKRRPTSMHCGCDDSRSDGMSVAHDPAESVPAPALAAAKTNAEHQ